MPSTLILLSARRVTLPLFSPLRAVLTAIGKRLFAFLLPNIVIVSLASIDKNIGTTALLSTSIA